MSTVVTYNGVEMHSVLVKRWDQDIVRDDSGTDVLYSKYILQFEGLLHAQGRPYVSPNTQETAKPVAPVWVGLETDRYRDQFSSVSSTYEKLRALLAVHRADLVVTMGNETVFRCTGAHNLDSPYRDVDNGPKPQSIQISQVVSSKAIGPVFKIAMTIECARVECADEPGVPIVLNNRWAVSESMDEKCFTTRTVRGKIRLSVPSGMDERYALENARTLVVPRLEQGFRRERIDFTPSLNGLEADYTIVDRQIHTSAPWPAAKLNVTHTEHTTSGSGFDTDLHIVASGHPGASKADLWALCVRIIEDRVGPLTSFGTVKDRGNKVITGFTMTDHIGEENVVECSLKMTHSAIMANADSGAGPSVGSIAKDAASTSIGLLNPTTAGPTAIAAGVKAVSDAERMEKAQAEKDGAIKGYMNGQIGSLCRPLAVEMPEGTPAYSPVVSWTPNIWGYNSQDPQNPRTPAGSILLACYLQSPCWDKHGIYNDYSSSISEPPTINQYPPDETRQPYDNSDNQSPGASQNYPPPASESEANQQALYTAATCETTYTILPCRVQLPIANSGQSNSATSSGIKETCVVSTLGLPQGRMQRHVDAERIGAQPIIPEPVDSFAIGEDGLAGWLTHFDITVYPPTVGADKAQMIYRIAATYYYALNRAPSMVDRLNAGVLPFTAVEQKTTGVTLDELKDDRQKFAYDPNASQNQPNA